MPRCIPRNSYIAVYDLPKVDNLKKLYPESLSRAGGVRRRQPRVKKGVLTVHRREILLMLAAAAVAGADPPAWLRAEAEEWEVTKTDEEWRRLLTPAQYQVLRHDDTEPPSSSPLVDEHRTGVFVCAGCELPLFKSETKFESGTGWPSFWSPIEGSVGTKTDRSLWMERTEVHCRRCGGHLGHVFKDGPPPTGLRYCMNGVALKFVPSR
jgi:peptide-methionine (R)-S-oxide reductase